MITLPVKTLLPNEEEKLLGKSWLVVYVEYHANAENHRADAVDTEK